MNKAFFLDRDGVINVEVNYLHTPEETVLNEGTAEAIRKINEAGYLAIVVSNQAGIAYGMYGMDDVKKVENKIRELLAPAKIDAFYYCPHHPEKGVIPEYTIDCSCRKPKPGMLLQSAADFDVDLSQSFMIGDRLSDIHAGDAAGVKASVMVLTGHGHKELAKAQQEGQIVKDDILRAVEYLLNL